MVSGVKKLPFELIFTTSFFGFFFFRDTAEIAERLSIFSISLLFRRMDNWKRICTSYTIFGFFSRWIHVALLEQHWCKIFSLLLVEGSTCTSPTSSPSLSDSLSKLCKHTYMYRNSLHTHTLLCKWKLTTYTHCFAYGNSLHTDTVFIKTACYLGILYSIYQKLVK